MTLDRRNFVLQGTGALAAGGIGLALSPRRAEAGAAGAAAATTAAVDASGSALDDLQGQQAPVDDSWLERIAGKKAQIFDAPKHLNGGILIAIGNFLNAMTGPHAFAAADVVPVLALHGTAIGLVMQDALWAKYKLGEKLEVDDPLTREKSLRNPWLRESDPAAPMARIRIAPLQERGLILLVCNNNLRGWTGMLARESQQTPEDTRTEILANLIPGAIVVPAAVAAVHRAQAAGAGYSYVGG